MLAVLILNSDVVKLNVFDEQIIMSQLADDTTVFLKGLERIPKVPKYKCIESTKLKHFIHYVYM